MKQRTTFIVKPDSPPTDPEQFSVTLESLDVQALHAARQERWTVPLSELPPQVVSVLKTLSEFRVRWSNVVPHEQLDPFSSTVPPGLHVFVKTGGEEGVDQESPDKSLDKLCHLLGTAFGGEASCTNIPKSFIPALSRVPDIDSQSPSSFQLYRELPDLSSFVLYTQTSICSKGSERCVQEAAFLNSADYLDIDFDETNPSKVLTIAAYWSRSQPGGPWDASFTRSSVDHRVEVGILDKRPPLHENKITLGGALCIIGEHDELKQTLFSFPTRHFHAPGSYNGSFKSPTGLHPTFVLQVEGAKAPGEECGLHAYFTLPKTFFVDRYQIAEKVPQSSPYGEETMNPLGSTWSFKNWLLEGEADLEAPVWAQSRWGSVFMMEIDTNDLKKDGLVKVELPLHLRYLEPAKGKESQSVNMPWPVVFWACDGQGSDDKLHINPFDRRNLGYDALFDPEKVYYHLSPSVVDSNVTYSALDVPILDLNHAMIVKVGTAILVVSGFLYITFRILFGPGKGTKGLKVE